MKVKNNLLIEELLATTAWSTRTVEKLKELGVDQLNVKSSPAEWSVLECVEHLNLYGNFYLPVIEQAILSYKPNKTPASFKSGFIGGYFVNMIRVKPGKMKKMSTTKDKNPLGYVLTLTTVDRFLKQQQLLKTLLEQARYVDMTKLKTPISITKMVRLRLGDTLRFVVYHIERHVIQAERANI
ncbi:DinB family protein [Pedobacter foliorum]|uniref:DinB family protein n=1 Tax=Pedobacter foliorum TaxID=2739058 RepID=UPI001565197F|nr:DinB family protein [Pedobacter foliorum]NRF40359.1 DinB family protein [Pedobacter foliorum]